MSRDWVNDIHQMHKHYGVHEWINGQLEKDEDFRLLHKFLSFRLKFLQEELWETIDASKNKDPEEIVDGLIDLCVVAIGTLDAFNIDAHKAWERVLEANMAKEVGVKESRPNELGLPDLVKPEGWKAPDHKDNHGYLPYSF